MLAAATFELCYHITELGIKRFFYYVDVLRNLFLNRSFHRCFHGSSGVHSAAVAAEYSIIFQDVAAVVTDFAHRFYLLVFMDKLMIAPFAKFVNKGKLKTIK
jgi:hypothetical protein